MKKYLPYLTLLIAVLFTALTAIVMYIPKTAAIIDSFGAFIVKPIQTHALVSAFYVFTNFGSIAGIVGGVVVLVIIYRHRPDIIARLAIALVGAAASGAYLKSFLHRARPETLSWLPQILNSYSYPSGHSNGSMVFYGFLGVLLFMHSTTKIRRVLSVVVPGLMILLVGLSRLVLDYHYATDVLGGYLLGAFWLVFSFSIPLFWGIYHQNPKLPHAEPISRPLL